MFCFIYVLTHNDKIIIVHSIEISNTKTTNLLTTLTKTTSDEKLIEGKIILKLVLFILNCLVGSTPEKLKEILHPHY
jgi:hypothetical protein